MKRIKKLVDKINDEICGAKDYAECYIDAKVKNDTTWASRYVEMSEDELRHAMYLHELVEKEIADLSKVYVPSTEMMEKWEKAHAKYLEKIAIIKQLLSL